MRARRACACVCVHMRAYTSVCVRMLTYASVCVRMRAYARVCVRMRAYAYVCVRMRAYACVCVRMRAYACVRVRMRVTDFWFARGYFRALAGLRGSDAAICGPNGIQCSPGTAQRRRTTGKNINALPVPLPRQVLKSGLWVSVLHGRGGVFEQVAS